MRGPLGREPRMRATIASVPRLQLRLARMLGCFRAIMLQYEQLADHHTAAQPDRAMELRAGAERMVLRGQRLCLALAGLARGQADLALSQEAWDVAAAYEERALLMEHQAAVFPELVVLH